MPTGAESTLAAMSEKRRQHQQRRQRRKAQGAAPPRARRSEEARLLAEMARLAASDAPEIADVLEAEEWASHLIGTWHQGGILGGDVDALFLPGFVAALEALGTASALAVLRALSAVSAPEHAARASAAAGRLAAAGLPEPPWAGALGPAHPTAALLAYDEAFDDGVSVMVEFGSHTLGVYVDHNLGGLVKDVFVAGPLAEIREMLRTPGVSLRKLDLGEGRARVEAALYKLDHTLDPPVNEDVRRLRALVEARTRVLPAGFTLPDEYRELAPEEREALLAGFLASPEGERWRGDDEAEDVAMLAIEFGADYNHGGPLRWSPVVVEIFMLDWLARKVTPEPGVFERLPEVLSDWVRYAGHQRGVPEHALREAVAAVAEHGRGMLETVNDPAAWGPAKALATAALSAGVDLTDRDQLEAFIRRYNDGLAA